MKNSSEIIERPKRGRPRVGSTQINVKLAPSFLAALDTWIGGRLPKMTRSEAIRRILAEKLLRA